MTSVAFLGAGIMGAPMAANAADAGLDVTLWNRTREKAEAIDGVSVADTPEQAVDGADLVVTMLTDGDAVDEVARQFLGAVKGDAVWLQMSTVGITATDRLVELAGEHDVTFVDAPVLGTKEPAEQGNLVVLAGGPADAIEKARPLFDAVGSKVVELGVGEATRLKLVLNNWVVTVVEGTAETIALAERLGLDPQRFLSSIEGGALDSPYVQMKGKMMIEREFPPSFPLALARKDARLVMEAAAETGGEAPLAQLVDEQFTRAIDLGHGDKDMAAAYFAQAPDGT
jgi:3-hydroxyisobutyrate dehydrogenase